MKKIGLTLGKFAPLHKGHQFMIETALRETDELFILIYATKVTDIPLNVRAGWLRKLYPNTRIIECHDVPPEEVRHDRGWIIMQEDYVVKMLGGQKITHFFSSEPYGAHVAQRLNAIDRRVDEARKIVPISATKIRNDTLKYRDFIDDIVYPDLIVKI